MRVSCKVFLGNDADMNEVGLGDFIFVEGEPFSRSKFIEIHHGDLVLQVPATDLLEAIKRCQSESFKSVGTSMLAS